MRKFLTAAATAAVSVAVAALTPGSADAMSTAYATFDGPINATSNGGDTDASDGGHCVQVQSAATPSGANDCRVAWSLNPGKSLCAIAEGETAGWADYKDFRTGSTYSGITLYGAAGAANGVFTGQWLDGAGRVMQITINASDPCPAIDLAESVGVGAGAPVSAFEAARSADRFTGRVNAVGVR
ncbi:MAG TPA: hypothetical protein VGX28_09670 [Frankiaceae bacterium]|jgi:hypothetical protein|nr:hypothetical protein [Frankiaceae bacterium]